MAGLTSVITQSYEGASNNGVEGLISGFGKGVIGTVTKPALGILDFATGAAATIRDGSRGGGAGAGNALVRPTRVCHGPGESSGEGCRVDDEKFLISSGATIIS